MAKCRGVSSSGEPCEKIIKRDSMFCQWHRKQLTHEQLQCPKECGQLSWRSDADNRSREGFYQCKQCMGIDLDAKAVERYLLDGKSVSVKRLLESGEPGTLKCPSCEALMFVIRVECVLREPENGGGFGHIGTGPVAIGLVAIGAVVVVAGAVVESSKKAKAARLAEEGGYGESAGDMMVLDGCRECGSFWFDGGELGRIQNSLRFSGTTGEAIAEANGAVVREWIHRNGIFQVVDTDTSRGIGTFSDRLTAQAYADEWNTEASRLADEAARWRRRRQQSRRRHQKEKNRKKREKREKIKEKLCQHVDSNGERCNRRKTQKEGSEYCFKHRPK